MVEENGFPTSWLELKDVKLNDGVEITGKKSDLFSAPPPPPKAKD